ncbi:MAG: insulinase family protein, partial [Oscillospiraceae bacterium]
VNALDGETVAKAYEELLKTAQVEIFCTGGSDFEEIKESMKAAFGGISRLPHPLTKYANIFPQEKESFNSETMEVSQAKLVMAFRPTRVLSQREQNSMRVMSALFGGTPASKLFLNVREKLSLCYYCSASYNPLTSLMVVDSGVENENAGEAQKQILVELDKIRHGDFTEDEIDKTKKLMINALNTIEDSPQSMEDWYLRGGIEGVTCSPTQRIQNILAVTAEEIAAIANLIITDGIFLLKGGNN